MVRRIWKSHVGPVAALLALFVSLGGPAWAADFISGSSIKPSSLTGRQVKDSSLTGLDVLNSSITGTDIKNESVDGRDIKNASIATVDVKDASLTGADVADGSIGASDLAAGVIPSIADGSIGTVKLADGSVVASKLADGSVTSAKFAADAMSPFAAALPGFRTVLTTGTSNVIGGASDNVVTPGVVGATTAGGGAAGSTFRQNVTDDYGTIAGGRGNRTGDTTGTTSDAIAATVGGGEGNTATGSYATIPGGLSNSAGMFSFAAGRRAKALHTGSFVWADSTNADFSSTADNQVSFRAANGVFVANDAGGAKVVPVGTRYRDNSIVAWGRVSAIGTLESNFNVASVARATNTSAVPIPAGAWRITLNNSLGSGFSLVPTVTPELDPDGTGTPPSGAANVRFAVTNQVASGNVFDVYIYNGSFNLVDNDFTFMVTGR